MKAVVLAGGYGTRLWPISRNRPKMLLPLGETVILDTILAPLERDARIGEVIISTNRRFEDDLKSFVLDSEYNKPRLSVEQTHSETEKLGAVGALANLIEKEQLRSDIIVIAGDHYIDFPLEDFIDYFESVNGPAITAREVESERKAKSYGVIDIEDEKVVSFVEKPSNPRSTLISPACYAFPSNLLGKFEEFITEGHDSDAPGWFVQWLIKQTRVYAHIVDGMIMDVGTRENYIEAVGWALDGDNYVAEGAIVENSELLGCVSIHNHAEVRNSRISDSVIFSGAHLEDLHLSNSVVDMESSLVGGSLTSSLIGPWTKLRYSHGTSRN